MELTEKQAIDYFEAHRQEVIEAVSKVIMAEVDVYDVLMVSVAFPYDFPCEAHMEDADDLFTEFIRAEYSLLRSRFTKIVVLGMQVPVPKDLQ